MWESFLHGRPPFSVFGLLSRGGNSRAPTSTRYLLTRQLANAVVAEISLLRAAAGIAKGSANGRALTFFYFFPAAIADQNCLSRHVGRSF